MFLGTALVGKNNLAATFCQCGSTFTVLQQLARDSARLRTE